MTVFRNKDQYLLMGDKHCVAPPRESSMICAEISIKSLQAEINTINTLVDTCAISPGAGYGAVSALAWVAAMHDTPPPSDTLQGDIE